jgi:hypothetical protein
MEKIIKNIVVLPSEHKIQAPDTHAWVRSPCKTIFDFLAWISILKIDITHSSASHFLVHKSTVFAGKAKK